MEPFRWTSDFETGLEEIDKQHHQLIDLINKIGNFLTQKQISTEELRPFTVELNHYVVEHFQEEEQLMTLCRVDPRHKKIHITAHREFLDEINKFEHLDNSNQHAQVKQLLDYLIQWLAYHILGIDQELAKQVQYIESGEPPATAYSKAAQPKDLATEPLITALRGLFHQVSVRNHELLELNQNLEKKVQERTLALQKTNQHLQSLAHTDVLTGLPNRRHAMIQLKELWQQSLTQQSPLVCMMIDADHFKQINDQKGHDAGDTVLMLLARNLRESVRSDDVVARLGGDEFLLICPDTDQDGALRLGSAIRQRVANLSINQQYKISVSVGIASRSSEMTHHEAMIKAADKAVYQAKADGKNCVRMFQPKQDEPANKALKQQAQ
ncbi:MULTISPECIES: GGDEF domain-containing protein [unclassified Agarivorans]|uniref:GGDEF domain-containing protein n=1 Tax=unclassified Agarivorans TaxID=2636026 RepID=UPI003D7D5075